MTELPGQHGAHADLFGSTHILFEPVAHEDSPGRGHAQARQGRLIDARMRLAHHLFGGEDRHVEILEQAEPFHVLAHHLGQQRHVGDKPELEALILEMADGRQILRGQHFARGQGAVLHHGDLVHGGRVEMKAQLPQRAVEEGQDIELFQLLPQIGRVDGVDDAPAHALDHSRGAGQLGAGSTGEQGENPHVRIP